MPKAKIIFRVLALFAVISFAFYLAHLATGSEVIQEIVRRYGYLGSFLIAVFSGFNFLVPIPAASLMPLFIESGLSFLPTVIFITLGMTAADAISFFFG